MSIFTRDLGFVNFNNEEMQWVKFNNVIVYEAWKKLTANGIPPLVLEKCQGVDLIDYKIYGNTVQDGTPSIETPIEIQSVGKVGKNKFDLARFKNLEGWTKLGSYQYKKLYLEVGKTYTFSCYNTDITDNYPKSSMTLGILNPQASTPYIKLLYLCNGGSSPIVEKGDKTITFVANGNEVLYGYSPNWLNQNKLNAIFDEILLNVQVEEGNTITEFEKFRYEIPFKTTNENGEEKEVIICASQPLRKITYSDDTEYADYVDFGNQQIVRKVYEYEMGEGSKMQYGKSTVPDTTTMFRSYLFTNPKMISSNTGRGRGFCSVLPRNFELYNQWTKPQVYYGIANTSISVVTEVETNNITELYNYLSNNGENRVIFDYILQEEIRETFETFDVISIPSMPTFKGKNTLSIDTNIQPSNLEVVYKGK